MAPNICSLKGCNNMRRKGFGLFKIPNDLRKPHWAKFMLENGTAVFNEKACYLLCEDHFKESDIKRGQHSINLSKMAIPCFGVKLITPPVPEPQSTSLSPLPLFSFADEIKLEDGEGFLILEEDFSGDFYCRCCFKIFTLNSKFRELSPSTISLVEEFLGLELNFDEGSKQICDECHETLQNFSNFKTQTRRKQKHFSNLILRNEHRDVKKIEKLNENLDEIEMEEEIEVKIEVFEMEKVDVMEERVEVPKRLRRHFVQKNPRQRPPKTFCDLCKFSYTDIIAHRIKYHNLRHEFECQKCPFKTFSPLTFNNHHKEKHQEDKNVETSICPHCAISIRSSLLSNHIANVHEKVQNFFCDLCSYSSFFKSAIENHMLHKHMTERPFKCSKCSFSTSVKPRLTYHIKSVHERVKTGLKIPCVYAGCDVTVSTKHILKIHIRRCHEKDYSIKCKDPGCDRKFFNISAMKLHFNNCHGSRDFICDTCGSAYGNMRNLINHVERHSKKFPCTQCDLKFAKTWELRDHVKNIHERLKRFSCEKCGKLFYDNHQLKIHFIAKHTGVKIKCGVAGCSSEFTRRDTYVEHLRYAHKLSDDERKELKAKLTEFLSSLKVS